jgi:hypothetical protein
VVWLGFGIIWAGYATGLYGYSLVRGYNLTLAQMVSPVKWYQGKWPPAEAGNTQILPSGTAAGIQTTALQVANAPAGTATTKGGGTAPAQPVGIVNGATVRTVAATHGWGSGGQWNALTHLINGESGGNPTIRNAGSGALGIAQALGHGTSCSGGTLGNEYGPQYGLSCKQAQAANSGNATQQVRWMLGYIKSRYGSPVNAYSTWLSRSPHWY